jgi:23S rRNA pseudouridine1911/1915/1917 synthase
VSEKYYLTVAKGVYKERADKLLVAGFPSFSRADLHRAFEAGLVVANKAELKKNAKLSEGTEIVFSMPEVRASELKAVDISLQILHEDKHLLVIDKASGMVVHPGAGTSEDTLVHALLHYCKGQLSGIGGVERPGIVHRLDRETSGVIVVAKDDQTHRGLAEGFAQRTFKKEYLALVARVPELLCGSIKKSITRNAQQRHKMAVTYNVEDGKSARTDWEVVEKFGNSYALFRCEIHTGRTHQIRVHLSSEKHPLLGDAVYGFRPDHRFSIPPKRVMLHAERLQLTHPITGILHDFRAPVPDDFLIQCDELRRLFS